MNPRGPGVRAVTQSRFAGLVRLVCSEAANGAPVKFAETS